MIFISVPALTTGPPAASACRSRACERQPPLAAGLAAGGHAVYSLELRVPENHPIRRRHLMTEPRKGSLLVIFLAVFIDLLGFGMVLPLLAIYARDFGTKNGMVIGLLVASFSAMQFIFSPMWGRLSDRIGRRPVLMIGLAGSVIFYSLFGLATVWKSMAWLFVSRIGAGIAGATITTAQAYIADVTTLQNRGKGMALVGAAFGLGFTFGPLFGGLAFLGNSTVPRPEPGYAAALLSLCGLIFAYFMLPESLNPESKSAGKKLFDFGALRVALRLPSIGPLLLTVFVCILAFANFETTLSLLLSGGQDEVAATSTDRRKRSMRWCRPISGSRAVRFISLPSKFF